LISVSSACFIFERASGNSNEVTTDGYDDFGRRVTTSKKVSKKEMSALERLNDAFK